MEYVRKIEILFSFWIKLISFIQILDVLDRNSYEGRNWVAILITIVLSTLDFWAIEIGGESHYLLSKSLALKIL